MAGVLDLERVDSVLQVYLPSVELFHWLTLFAFRVRPLLGCDVHWSNQLFLERGHVVAELAYVNLTHLSLGLFELREGVRLVVVKGTLASLREKAHHDGHRGISHNAQILRQSLLGSKCIRAA